jgi:hypothetical protein
VKRCIIILVALSWSFGFVYAQVSYTNCAIDTSKFSSAIGYNSHSSGVCSFAAGYRTRAYGDNSFVFGSGKTFNTLIPTGYLASNCPNSFLIGFEEKTVFFAYLDAKLSHLVGIGTMDPKATLDVVGMTRTETLRIVNSRFEYSGETLDFYPWNEDGLNAYRMPTLFLNNNSVGIMTNNPTATLDVNGSVHVTGDVGIGTTSPEKKFHVQGDSYFSGNIGVGTTSPEKKFHVQGDSYFGGRVGIGTTSPEFPLDVGGDASFRDKVRANKIYFSGTEMKIGVVKKGILPLSDDDLEGDLEDDPEGDPKGGSNIPEYFVDIITLKDNGYVGIGTTNPAQTFHVLGTSYLNGATHISGNLGIGTTNPTKRLHVVGDSYLSGNLGVGTTEPEKKLHVDGDSYITGSLCIGTSDNHGYKLAVKGNIGATKIVLEDTDSWKSWPDYVFEHDYNLMGISELEKYVTENKHLPGIPNKEDVCKNGQDVGEINRLLLEKLEEMTLYIIDLQKQIDELKK